MLVKYLYRILRLTREGQSQFDGLREIVDSIDFSFTDRIREAANSEINLNRKIGPAKVVAIKFDEVDYENNQKESPIRCRGKDCNNQYTSEKAYNIHIRNKHKEDIKELSIPKCLNRITGRIGSVREARIKRQVIDCKICKLQSVELMRFNDHYKARHDRNFQPLGRKVC